MADEVESIQSILRRRRGAAFVGRGGQLALFRENFRLPPSDPRKAFIFNVHGEGGIGKSTLLERWRQVARDMGAVSALVDEHVFDTPGAMSAIMEQLEFPPETKDFRAKYTEFLKGRERLEGDPQAPRELWSQVVRTGVKAGLHASKVLPGAAPIIDLVDGDSAADAVDRARQYILGKFRDSREARLLLSPTEELSPAFLDGLRKIAAERPVVLFFDTFEQTHVFLEEWLLAVMSGLHGDLPGTVTLVIAGRHELDANSWSELLWLVAPVPLNPFTDAESRLLLAAQGIGDAHTVDTIIALSGGLPLLIDMLAKGRPTSSVEVGDPTGTAVERFLKWETDLVRRDAALAGSLPRLIDEDLLTAAMGTAHRHGLFDWLTDQAFVRRHTDRYRYHDVVRSPMVRWQRQRSPQRWGDAHRRLAAVYRDRRPPSDAESMWSNSGWLENHVELTYHELCARTAKLDATLAEGASAAAAGIAVARRWAETIADAARDIDDKQLQVTGAALVEAANADERDCARFLTAVLTHGKLAPAATASCLVERARIHHRAGRNEDAVRDATEAIRHDLRLPRAYAFRAAARGDLDDFAGALADFDQAITIDPQDSWPIGRRGELYRRMERYDEALAAFDRAIEMDPADKWVVASRGQTCADMKRYGEALADLSRAIELDPDYEWAIGERGSTYRLIGRYDEALADFDRAVELDPSYTWALIQRAETYRLAERHDEALADFDRATGIRPADAWAIGSRGQTYRAMKRYDEALADFDRAVELEPETEWIITERAATYRDIERHDEAIADYSRALERNPTSKWALTERAATYRHKKRYADALADLNRAVELHPDYGWALLLRGQTYGDMARYDDALADFCRVIALDPSDTFALNQRAHTFRRLRRYGEALADLTHAIERDEAPARAFADRGETYRRMKRYDEALADFDRAIELENSYEWPVLQRAETYRNIKRYDDSLASLQQSALTAAVLTEQAETHRHMRSYDEALAGFNRALELDPTYEWALACRGDLLRVLQRHEIALVDLNRAIELDPYDAESHVTRGLTHRELGHAAEAAADFEEAARLDPYIAWAIEDDYVVFDYAVGHERERAQQ